MSKHNYRCLVLSLCHVFMAVCRRFMALHGLRFEGVHVNRPIYPHYSAKYCSEWGSILMESSGSTVSNIAALLKVGL